MFATLQEKAPETARPATDELTELLSDLGFETTTLDIEFELAIDRFDVWNNPRDVTMLMSSGDYDTEQEETEKTLSE